MNRKYSTWLWFLLFLLLTYVPIFYNLDHNCIRLWDETRQVMNAKEMADNGQWLALYFEGEPENWSAKPTLMVACQALLVKTIGWTELAIRLPAAISALLTCFLVFYLFKAVFGRPDTGVLAAVVLLSFRGYVDDHAIRTGDFDAMLTLFITAAALSLYMWVIRQKPKWLYFFFLSIFLGVMTKGVAALLPGPAYLLFVLWSGKFFTLFKVKHTWFSAAILLLIPGYYLLHEHLTPGYLNLVWEEELGGRFEGRTHNLGGFWMYVEHFWNKDLGNWKWTVLPTFLIALSLKDEKKKWLARMSFLVVICHLLVISSSKTKLAWYDVPEYPFIAILLTLAVEAIADAVRAHFSAEGKFRAGFMAFMLVLLLVLPDFGQNWHRIYARNPAWDSEFYALPDFLKRNLKENPHALDNHKVIWVQEEYPYMILYYTRRFNAAGSNLAFSYADDLKVGDRFISTADHLEEQLAKKFLLQRVEVEGRIEIYELKEGQGRRE